MKPLAANALLSASLLIVCGIFLTETNKLTYPSNVFPYLLIATIAFFSLAILGQTVSAEKSAGGGSTVRVRNPGRVLLIVTTSLIYIMVLEQIGYYFTTGAYLLILSFFLPPPEMPIRKKAVNAVILTIAVILLIFAVFGVSLQVPTPKGILF